MNSHNGIMATVCATGFNTFYPSLTLHLCEWQTGQETKLMTAVLETNWKGRVRDLGEEKEQTMKQQHTSVHFFQCAEVVLITSRQ